MFRTITNAPLIDYLNSVGYEIGGSFSAFVWCIPMSIGADIEIIPSDAKIYWGGTLRIGLAVPGVEGHFSFTNTNTFEKTKFNIFDLLGV